MKRTILYKTKLEAAKLYCYLKSVCCRTEKDRSNIRLLVAEIFNISSNSVFKYRDLYLKKKFLNISENEYYTEYKKFYKKKRKSKIFIHFRRSDTNFKTLGIQNRMAFIFTYYQKYLKDSQNFKKPKIKMSLNYLSAIFGVRILQLKYWFKKFKKKKQNKLPIFKDINLEIFDIKKINIIKFYLNNKKNMTQKMVAQKLNITISQLYYCLRLYKTNKLQIPNLNLKTLEISNSEKINIVKFYLNNKKNMTQKMVAQKFNITISKLAYWLKLYKTNKLYETNNKLYETNKLNKTNELRPDLFYQLKLWFILYSGIN